MSVADYEAIVQRLDQLEPAQMTRFIGEIQSRRVTRKKHRLEDFLVVPEEARGTGEDWVAALRAEWDDRG